MSMTPEWFGPNFPRPTAKTPLGRACSHCKEEFTVFDTGRLNEDAAYHKECLTRLVSGSVGHQLKLCGCHGGQWDDPPWMTPREAARAAQELALLIHTQPW